MNQHINSDTLIDYLHHELSPSEDARVLSHLEACESCAREMNVEASIGDRLRSAARLQELELPLGMRSAILARIAEEARRPWDRLAAWLRPAIIGSVAAAVAAAAFYVGPTLQGARSNALPVSYYMQQYAVHAQQNPLADRGTMVLSSFNDGAR